MAPHKKYICNTPLFTIPQKVFEYAIFWVWALQKYNSRATIALFYYTSVLLFYWHRGIHIGTCVRNRLNFKI